MTGVFEAERPRLFAVAYRLLGSVAEAEDVLQDSWLAWQGVDERDVEEPAAYLTTVVTRRCLDVLRSARVRREHYPGPWLPDPLVGRGADAAEHVELAESVRMAFLVVLESLSPAERAAFVLHDVFGYGYGELARILDRSEAACRQLVSRARAHLDRRRPRFPADRDAAEVADRFLAACVTGDLGGLLALLHPGATLTSDGGGRVSAALRVVSGAGAVARFLAGVAARNPGARVERAAVNAAPGALVTSGGHLLAVAAVDVEDGRVRHVYMVRNPDKLGHLSGPAGAPTVPGDRDGRAAD